MSRTRVAAFLEHHQPGRTLRSIEVSAGLPAASLGGWLDDAARPSPTGLVSVEAMGRIATALGAPLASVSRAFTGTWFDLNGWRWNHFQTGDHVVVFSPPEPGTGNRRVRYGMIKAIDLLDVIDVELDDGTRHSQTPEGAGQLCHAAGCLCNSPR